MFNMIIARVTIVLIILLVVITIKYISVNDFPKCKHKQYTHLKITDDKVAEKCKSLNLSLTPEPIKYHGCSGHMADPLDIGKLKNGDIIMISYQGVRSWFSALVYGSIWTHAGLVYIDPRSSEPFIFEAANYAPPHVGQIVRIPLLKWMSINKNSKCISLVSINKPIPYEKLNEEYAKFENSDIGVQGLSLSWKRFLTKKTPYDVDEYSFFAAEHIRKHPKTKTQAGLKKYIFFGENTSSYFDYLLTCHEVIIHVLQKCGVFERKYTACSYLPNALFNREIKTINDYEYLEPIEVSVDDYVSNKNILLEKMVI